MLEQDHIDRLVAKWAEERPEYDLAPVQIIGRIARIGKYVDRALEAKFEEFGISRASFDVLATLRRTGHPYKLSQRELMKNLLRTSGSISVRMDAMERQGLVTREAGAEDRRATLVAITQKGTALLEEIIPHHLKNEERLVSALSAQDRRELIRLLRKWHLSLESLDDEDDENYLGMLLLNPRVSLLRRRAAGLPDVAGLLVHAVEIGGVAENAGLRKGDLIVAIGEIPVDSQVALRWAVNKPKPRVKSFRVLRGAESLEIKVPASGR
jgi:DNA-binding MarR family transcriptional regulator